MGNGIGFEIKNDAIVFGILIVILAVIFKTSSSSKPFFKKFYTYVPPLLLCYFAPGFLNWPLGLVSPEESQLYFVASRYLLPASLVLFCLSIDLKGVLNLGPKALIMFFTATLGIVIGAPVALWISGMLFPEIKEAVPGEEIWRGLSTIAGSWIGGGANQTAMKEIYNCSDSLFSSMIIIDVLVANIWMGFLLFGAGRYHKIDKRLKADNSTIEDLKKKVENYRASIAKIPTSTDLFVILAIGFGATAVAHFGADYISPLMEKHVTTLEKYNLNSLSSRFFWLIVIATTIGLVLSFTKMKRYEGAGASKLGSIFIYILVATIGMKMNFLEAFNNLHYFIIGLIWMAIHVTLLLIVAKLIKAPFFFVAVGSQANVGGAASAPVVASAFSTALAPVGVLLAVLGYALGTYGAIICTQLMQWTF
ncbi:DUF819 family protein [Maribellus comscasis]|uniref:DUF819 family protein n=1 Tax=Maribellus comscasis TaxID=2681766 RepID=A0A6I6JSB1_9BACT|nr:DUF819 family protein [Maribellus comscasis]QGY45945.1 DUF819 family protein [Maribellus comscasis]